MTYGLLDYNFFHYVKQLETTVFYIVPKDESLSKSVGKFYSLDLAKQFASNRKEEHGIDYDVIEVSTVWTTQTLDEALKLLPDIPHMKRDV